MSRGKRPSNFSLAPVGDYRKCWCCRHGFISMKCLLHGFHLGADRETHNCKDYSEEGMDIPPWIKRDALLSAEYKKSLESSDI